MSMRLQLIKSACAHAQSLSIVSDSCDPMNYSPPVSSVHGVFQAGILEWLPFPLPGDLPDPGIEPAATALQAVSLPYESPAAAAAKSLQSVRLCATP